MIIYCTNTISGLKPNYDSDFEEKKKLKLGTVYKCEITHPRNYGFHQKFFALLNLGYQNSPNLGHLPFDIYRKILIMYAGFVDAFTTPKGTIYEAQSISFNKMSQETFEDLYGRVMDEIVKDLGCTSKELEMELVGFM